MKTKLNDIGIIKQSLGWLAVFAGAGLAVGAMNYRELGQKIELAEKNSELTQALVQATHANAMLHQIGEGQTDEAKKQLSSQLAYDVTVIKSLSSSVDGWNHEFAQGVIQQVAKDEKKHPDYYVASSRLGSADSGEVMQVVRH